MRMVKTRINRRYFMQGSTMALAAGFFADLSLVTQALALDCPITVPGLTIVPRTLYDQPGLIALRAEVLYQQICRNYGYFGQPRNWTPLWSYAQLSQNVQNLLTNGNTTYNALQAMTCNVDAQRQVQDNYTAAIKGAQDVQSQLRSQMALFENRLRDLAKLITNLKHEILDQRIVVNTVQANFDAAVLNAAGGGCSFMEVLEIVVIVVAVVAAVFTAGSSLVAAYGAVGSLAASGVAAAAALGSEGLSLFNQLKSDYEQFKPIVSQVETAVQTAINDTDDLVAKYKKLQSALAANSDSARVIVEQTSFDALSDAHFQAFESAVNGVAGVDLTIKKQLTDAVQKYFDLAQLRNKKIQEYDSTVVAIQDDARQWYEMGVEAEKLNGFLGQLQTRLIPQEQFLDSVTKVQSAQLTMMRRAVWDEKRSYAFSQVNPDMISDKNLAQLHIQGMIPSVLLLAHNDILGDMGSTVSTSGTRNITQFNPPIEVQLGLTDSDRQRFASTGQFLFSIKPEAYAIPQSRVETFVTGFKITCSPAAPGLIGNLIHLGNHRFQKLVLTALGVRSVTDVYFSSFPVSTGIQTGNMPNFTDMTNLNSPEQIPGVSAFGDWMLEAAAGVPASVVQSIQRIQIEFQGNYLSPPV